MADRKITLNKTFTVDLAGDSIWSNENPASVEVTGITLRETDYGDGDVYWDAEITHNGPWEIYTDRHRVRQRDHGIAWSWLGGRLLRTGNATGWSSPF